jgi:hypothetical protein
MQHWKGLPTGARLRRAARHYSEAVGSSDPIDSFQTAYAGLEALEKPLALEAHLEPGTEVQTGHCEKCRFEFQRRKTALVGVRALVTGKFHDRESDQTRKEWRTLSDLRHGIVHSLKDDDALEGEAAELRPAICHHLHVACAHLAHLHELEKGEYGIGVVRTALFEGRLEDIEVLRPMEKDCSPIVLSSLLRWSRSPEFGMLPEYSIETQWPVKLRTQFLSKPISVASEADLEIGRGIETVESDGANS